MDTAYTKSRRKDGGYDYYEFTFYPGQDDRGYAVGVSFMETRTPIIFAFHKEVEMAGAATAWSRLQKGTPISEEEYRRAFDRATSMSWFRVL